MENGVKNSQNSHRILILEEIPEVMFCQLKH